MKRRIFTLVMILMPASLGAATYSFTGQTYSTGFVNFTSCTIGTCQNFTNLMSASGTFTTASPLAANLAGQNVVAQVTSYSFSDGIDTYTNTDANSRIYEIGVTTNGSGQLVAGTTLLFELWRSGTSPHAAGDRFDYLFITTGQVLAFKNHSCGGVGLAFFSGVADACLIDIPDASSSSAQASPGGSFSIAAPAVPTLSEWGVITLSGLLGLVGWITIRRGLAQPV